MALTPDWAGLAFGHKDGSDVFHFDPNLGDRINLYEDCAAVARKGDGADGHFSIKSTSHTLIAISSFSFVELKRMWGSYQPVGPKFRIPIVCEMPPPYLEDGAELPDHGHAAHPEVLADGHLEKEEGDAADQHGEEVGDEEGAWKKNSFSYSGIKY